MYMYFIDIVAKSNNDLKYSNYQRKDLGFTQNE